MENKKCAVVSASVPVEMAEWLKKHKGEPHASPSHLLQNAIYERMQEEGDILFETNAQLKAKIERILKNLQKSMKFLEEKGLINEYLGIDDKV